MEIILNFMDFPVLEDITEELTSDLDQRGFSRVETQSPDEVVRYAKRDSPVNFQVAIEPEEVSEEPDYNHVLLVLKCDSLKETRGSPDHLIPNTDLMLGFFRNTNITNQSPTFTESLNSLQNGVFNAAYHIGFEKAKTSAPEMKAVLREAADYFCDYVTANVQMLTKTQYLKE